MKKLIQLIFFITFITSSSNADALIHFSQRYYTVRDIITKIENDTPYNVNLPFADTANQKKNLPAKILLNELLFWLCRYYEKNNNIFITFEKNKSKINFKALHQLDTKATQNLLNKPIHLDGHRLTINDALNQAAKQLNIKIILPLIDSKALKADYNYKCTLEEFLSEVRTYFKTHLNQYIIYSVHGKKIEFFKNGRTLNKPLQVEFVSPMKDQFNQSTRSKISKELISKKIAQLKYKQPVRREGAQGSVIKKIPTLIKSVFKKTPDKKGEAQSGLDPRFKHLSTNAFKSNLEKLKRTNITRFIQADDDTLFIKTLITPHNDEGQFSKFFLSVKDFFQNVRGLNSFKKLLLSLDDNLLLDYDRNAIISSIRELWLKQSMERVAKKSKVKSKPRQSTFYTSLALGVGNNLSKSGPSTKILNPNRTNQWIHNQVSWQDSYVPNNKLQLNYGLVFDYLRTNNSSATLSDLGSISINISGSHIVTKSSLRAITPYLNYIIESDLLGSKSVNDHNLLILGNKFHWMKSKNRFGFDNVYADSDVMISRNSTHANEKLNFLSLVDRNSNSLSFKHQFVLLNSHATGIRGPRFGFHIIHRNSSSVAEHGQEYGINFGYLFQNGKIKNLTKFEYDLWARDDNVNNLGLSHILVKTINHGRNELFIKANIGFSKSNDPIMDYDYQALSIGGKIKW